MRRDGENCAPGKRRVELHKKNGLDRWDGHEETGTYMDLLWSTRAWDVEYCSRQTDQLKCQGPRVSQVQAPD